MNWQTFKINNQSHETAFESLCDNLFENWCRETYKGEISKFTVVNGSGGDGGVESYAVLKDGNMIGLQAKWFPNAMQSSQINQIKNSVETALNNRPEIIKYIVCIPRNLSSLTGKGENCEEKRWENLVSNIKEKYPQLEIILWNDYELSKELRKDTSKGILKYWFENSEISYDKLLFSFDKSKQSWLQTKYVPELNTVGKIYNTLVCWLGDVHSRENLITSFTKINSLAVQLDSSSKDLIDLIKEKTEDAIKLKKLMLDFSQIANELKISADKILNSLYNDSYEEDISYEVFYHYFKSLASNIKQNKLLYPFYFHTKAVIDTLNALGDIINYDLIEEYQKNICRGNIIIKGEPGTGKTNGVSSVAEKVLQDKYHAVILIQAKDIEISKTWKDIVISSLGLSSNWDEDELWQALISMVNTNKFDAESIESEIKVTPKVLIVVDGVDESSTTDKWEDRMRETVVISKKYPQIRFCVTARPFVFNKRIDGVKTEFLNPYGDVKISEIFDAYINFYNITVKNSDLLKNSLTTPLSLKLFCELNQSKTIDFDEEYDVSLPALLSKKINLIDAEFSRFAKSDIKNQYILKAIKELTEWFFTHKNIEHTELVLRLIAQLGVDKNLASSIIDYLQKYGILNCYCQHNTNPFECSKYIYSPGIRSYFDHASTLLILQRYGKPSDINFNDLPHLSKDTLYGIAVVAIRKYGYLITHNKILSKMANDYTLAELQYWALLHSTNDVAKNYEESILEGMKQSSELLYTIVNRLVLPLANKINHPLGVNLLDKFLFGFDKPAERDIIWSPIGYLDDSYDKKWGRNVSLEIEGYPLSEEDTFEGLPTIYAWALSSLNNSLRANYRRELMRWALCQPMEFLKLIKKFASVNDTQIISDLFSILMCLVYETNDVGLTRESNIWICENVLSEERIDVNRSIAIRYYAIAVVRKAIELKICNEDDVHKFLPPYSANNYKIKLSKEALAGSRMGGFKGITYDLARYVLIDHIEGDFYQYNQRKNKVLNKFLSVVCSNLEGVENIDFEHFILSAAYAYIIEMGWNENDFRNYNLDQNTNKIFGGIDCSIAGTYWPADHGTQSNVMTVCEKYVWQARDYIYGFLSDRLNFAETNERITDYGMLQDFIIPIQEMGQIDPDKIPEDNPWHIPERDNVINELECDTAEEVRDLVKTSIDIDWEKWLFINANSKYKIKSSNLLALYNYSCFNNKNLETCLFINSVIVEKSKLSKFVHQLQTKDSSTIIGSVSELFGGIEADCYITPKECCWFSWKEHYEPYELERFDGVNLQCSVDKGCWSHNEFGDVFYRMPSIHIRKMLGIVNSDGYAFFDKDGNIQAEYTVAGIRHNTYQEYVLVDKNSVLSLLDSEGKTIIWFMRELRRESIISREKFGEFYAEKDTLSIGYFEDGIFTVKRLDNS